MEKDNHLPKPTATATATATSTATVSSSDHSDPSLQRKHAAMIERLSNLHQTRLTRKPDPESNSYSSSFLSHFTESKNSIESTLTRIRQTPDPHSDPTLKPELDNVSISIANLEKILAENTFSLPSYDVRTCLKTLTDLKQFVEQVASEVIPRKIFSFKNKSRKKFPNTEFQGSGFRVLKNSPAFKDKENDVASYIPVPNVESKGSGFRGQENDVAFEIPNTEFQGSEFRILENSPAFRGKANYVASDILIPNVEFKGIGFRDKENDVAFEIPIQNLESKGFGFRVLESPGYRGKENEVLVKELDKGNNEKIREFVLFDLRGCEVRLMGCVRALFVHKLIDCKVYVGSVFGSVLIEEVENCVFVMASHQIRIHQAKGCDFYLRVRSRPIIEDSNGVRFAPYCLKYDGIEKDLEEANLGEETGNWSNVDDFKWLRAVQSPNWSILPENERLGIVDISNPEPKV